MPSVKCVVGTIVAVLCASAATPPRSFASPFAYVTDNGTAVAVIDTATQTIAATVTVGPTSIAAAANPNGQNVYVAGGGSVSVIDTATNAVAATIPIFGGNSLHGAAVKPTGDVAYVSSNGFVDVIDTATNTVTATITTVGPSPQMGLVVTPDGSKLYIANSGDVFNPGSQITVVDTATNVVTGNVTVGPIPTSVDVAPNGTRLYVGNQGGLPRTVSVVDTSTNSVVATVNLPATPQAVAVTTDSARVYVTLGNNTVSVIDAATNTIVGTVPVGTNPKGIAATPDGTQMYVANNGSKNVSVIDTTTVTVVATISVAPLDPWAFGRFIGPFIPAVCGNGAVESGEQCDDGNTSNGDCCSSTCQFEAAASPCTDGNACTDDACDGAGTCVHTNNSTPCDDGLFCNGADTCGGGGCTVHAGDPCTGGGECGNVCNEALDTCFLSSGTPCSTDGNPCTDDQCDGAGTCGHTNNTAPCDDGLFCNGTDTCSGGTCVHAGDPCTGGTECNSVCNEAADNCITPDGTPCTFPDACITGATCFAGGCSPGSPVVCPLCDICDSVDGCIDAPNPVCKGPAVPRKSTLQITDKATDASDQISYKWNAGSNTQLFELGDPLTTNDYALCLYAGGGSTLIFKATAPAGSTCGAAPCWKAVGTTGYRYKSKDGAPDGAVQLQLKTGISGKAKASFKGKGLHLDNRPLGLPAPPLSLPVKAQLQGENGACFQAFFNAPDANKPGSFKSKD